MQHTQEKQQSEINEICEYYSDLAARLSPDLFEDVGKIRTFKKDGKIFYFNTVIKGEA